MFYSCIIYYCKAVVVIWSEFIQLDGISNLADTGEVSHNSAMEKSLFQL